MATKSVVGLPSCAMLAANAWITMSASARCGGANIPGDEPIVMVEMVNLTCERDGSFKRYLLRVPPNIQTAHEAVAWTFDVPAKDYAPQIES